MSREIREFDPFMRYGDEDGPVLSRRCPKCGRLVKMPETVAVNDAGLVGDAVADCSRCGPVALDLLGWGGDL